LPQKWSKKWFSTCTGNLLRGEKLSHAVIKPSNSGFFVIHSVGRCDKTGSLGDKTGSRGVKPSDSVGHGEKTKSLGETRRENFCTIAQQRITTITSTVTLRDAAAHQSEIYPCHCYKSSAARVFIPRFSLLQIQTPHTTQSI
jgi:hypothetical protein